jgi:hypothetical protein
MMHGILNIKKTHKNNLLYIICVSNPTKVVTILMEEISISSGAVLKVWSKWIKCCRPNILTPVG